MERKDSAKENTNPLKYLEDLKNISVDSLAPESTATTTTKEAYDENVHHFLPETNADDMIATSARPQQPPPPPPPQLSSSSSAAAAAEAVATTTTATILGDLTNRQEPSVVNQVAATSNNDDLSPVKVPLPSPSMPAPMSEYADDLARELINDTNQLVRAEHSASETEEKQEEQVLANMATASDLGKQEVEEQVVTTAVASIQEAAGFGMGDDDDDLDEQQSQEDSDAQQQKNESMGRHNEEVVVEEPAQEILKPDSGEPMAASSIVDAALEAMEEEEEGAEKQQPPQAVAAAAFLQQQQQRDDEEEDDDGNNLEEIKPADIEFESIKNQIEDHSSVFAAEEEPKIEQILQTSGGNLVSFDTTNDNIKTTEGEGEEEVKMEFTKNYSDDLLMGQNDGANQQQGEIPSDLADFELPPYSGSSSGSDQPPKQQQRKSSSSSSSAAAQQASSSSQNVSIASNPNLKAVKNLLMSSYSEVSHVFHWKKPIESGAFFGIGITLIIALTFFSIISVVAYTALGAILASGLIRTYKAVMKTLNRSPDTPFDSIWEKVLSLNVSMSPEKMHELVDNLHGNLNASMVYFKQVLLVEDKIATLKFGFFIYLLTYIGSWFNGMTLITISYLALFSVPIFYEKNKDRIDENLNLATGQISSVVSFVTNKVSKSTFGSSAADSTTSGTSKKQK